MRGAVVALFLSSHKTHNTSPAELLRLFARIFGGLYVVLPLAVAVMLHPISFRRSSLLFSLLMHWFSCVAKRKRENDLISWLKYMLE